MTKTVEKDKTYVLKNTVTLVRYLQNIYVNHQQLCNKDAYC